ncbi:MAG: signal peptidase II [Candidatus Omnitrophota bacterium]
MGFIVSVIVVFLDQLTKSLALEKLTDGLSIPILKNIFHLTLVKNTGIAFGLFRGSTIIFVFISFIAVILILWYWLLKKDELGAAVKFALFLILGGSIGNFIDRIHFGYVVDFLDFGINNFRWPAFNIADSAITIGAVLICIQFFSNSAQ